jgi:peptide/nickel transport system ATP-binding protein/oligopeptide transport system ATP-binding protein
MSLGASLVSIRNLQVHFPLRHRRVTVKAVDGVSFDVMAGQTLGIIGESGSGKSTLGRALIGLITPTGGSVLHEGSDPFRLSRNEFAVHRRDYVAVFQDPHSALDPRMTIAQSVQEPLDIVGELPHNKRNTRVAELLERVGLNPDHGQRYPHELSGGQKQRANIARALTLNPKLIVCDEVVAALDVSIQAEILNLFADLQRAFKLTYIFISHDLGVVAHVSDHIAVMYLGKIVEYGPAADLMRNPLHPYTRALLSAEPCALPARLRTKKQVITLQGEIPSPLNPPSGCRFRTRCWMVRDVCSTEPPLRAVATDRQAACHFVEQTPSHSAQLEPAKQDA